MYKTIGEFLTTLPEQQLVEVYDKNHNLSFKGKAGFAPVWLDREPYYSSRSEEFTGIDGKKGTRYLINEIYDTNASKEESANSSLNASSRDYILPEYRDLYDEVGFQMAEVLRDSIKAMFDKELSPESIKKKFSEYDTAWADVAGNTSDLDSAVYAAAEAISDELVDLYFKAAPEATNSNRHLNSAGVIRIGNKAIPTDTRDLGYADYETVQREGKRLEEEDRIKKKNEALAEKGKAIRQAYDDALAEKIGAPAGDLIDAAFEVLVPSSGRADTQAGEIIRALSRLRYRYYNDGDYFYTGYGLETAGSDAAWLYDNVPASQKLLDDATMNEWTGAHYEEMLDDLSQVVLDYIDEHAEVFGQEPTADSRQYSSYRLSEWEDESYSEEFEVDVSGDYMDQCIENGWLDWNEVYYFLEGCIEDTNRGRVNQWARDGFTITDINSEEYDRLERELYGWMGEWLEEIIAEHADDEEDEDY